MTISHRVEHPDHGKGTITRLLDGGRRLVVRFDDSLVPRILKTRDLLRSARNHTNENTARTAPKSKVEPSKKTSHVARESEPNAAPPLPPRKVAAEPAAIDARQALEALRTGVVPGTGLDRLNVGRAEQSAEIDRLLAQQQGIAVVSGGYGNGKTHFLEQTAIRALGSNWLVARATCDPEEVPPSNPLRLYAALIRGLTYPDGSGRGLQPLLEKVGDSDPHLNGDRWHRWLSLALFAVHRADPRLSDEVLEFVSGYHRSDYPSLYRQLRAMGYRGESPLALPDWRTFGQVMAYLLGGIAAWAQDAGYSGLLVLMDEAEYVDRLDSTSRDMARRVLRYLAMGTLPATDLGFDPDTVARGGHRSHRSIPARYTNDQPLAVIAAFAPNPSLDGVLRGLFAGEGHQIDLPPFARSELGELVDAVTDLVAAARPGPPPDAHLRKVLHDAVADAFSFGEVEDPRQVARMAVEFWDIQRHLGDQAALEALGR